MKTKTFLILSGLFIFSVFLFIKCKKDSNEPQNLSPTTPSNPTPSSGAAAQPWSLILKWSKCTDPESNPVSYDIYIGTTNTPPLVQADWADTTYSFNGMTAATTYYWKIVAKDDQNNSKSGAVWMFITKSNSGIHFNPAKTYGTFTDSRDSKIYKTIDIGNQTWMAQNLDYVTASGSWYYNDDTSLSVYGRLYDWYTASSVCPTGWHLPSDVEFQKLIDTLGGYTIAGGKLKETDTIHWKSPNTAADNSSGFTALPNGIRTYWNNGFNGNSVSGYFWSTKTSGSDARFMQVGFSSANGFILAYTPKGNANSVRCLKD